MEQFIEFLKNADVVTSSVVAALTLILGLGTSVLGLLAVRLRKTSETELDKITETVRASAAEARSQVLKTIAEKLPVGTSEEDLDNRIQELRIGGDLVINTVGHAGGQLVEDLVTSYHEQALSQARVQFWFSVVAATFGFIYIMYAATTADPANLLSYMKTAPGVVVEAIAALFFRQAEQTRQRATELYDRLRTDQMSARAEAVVNSIEDPVMRSAVKAQIALHMIGLVPKEIDLQSILTRPIGSASAITKPQ
jgi:hypothetical protein